MTDALHLTALILLGSISLGMFANEVILRLSWRRRINKLAAKQQKLRMERISSRRR